MSLELAFQEPATFTVRAAGSVTYDQVQVLLRELRAHPLMRAGVSIIVDARDVDSVPTTSELRVIAVDLKTVFDLGLEAVAIVADQTFVYGVARMFAAFAEALGQNVHAFRCADEAHAWLHDQPHAA
jgi:hypothetical protein